MNTVTDRIQQVKQVFQTIPQKVIDRYSREYNIPRSKAVKYYHELTKFLLACSQTTRPLSPSQIIDEAWHNFILFTKDYGPWCREQLGSIVHHVPSDERDEDGYEKAVEFLAVNYAIDRRFWPVVSGQKCSKGCTKCSKCSKCSKCGKCESKCSRN